MRGTNNDVPRGHLVPKARPNKARANQLLRLGLNLASRFEWKLKTCTSILLLQDCDKLAVIDQIYHWLYQQMPIDWLHLIGWVFCWIF